MKVAYNEKRMADKAISSLLHPVPTHSHLLTITTHFNPVEMFLITNTIFFLTVLHRLS